MKPTMIDEEYEAHSDDFAEFGRLLMARHSQSLEEGAEAALDVQANLERFGRLLRSLRKERRYSQGELAELSGLSYATVMALENGLISADQISGTWLTALAEALNTDVEMLRLLLVDTQLHAEPGSGQNSGDSELHESDARSSAPTLLAGWLRRLGLQLRAELASKTEALSANPQRVKGRRVRPVLAMLTLTALLVCAAWFALTRLTLPYNTPQLAVAENVSTPLAAVESPTVATSQSFIVLSSDNEFTFTPGSTGTIVLWGASGARTTMSETLVFSQPGVAYGVSVWGRQVTGTLGASSGSWFSQLIERTSLFPFLSSGDSHVAVNPPGSVPTQPKELHAPDSLASSGEPVADQSVFVLLDPSGVPIVWQIVRQDAGARMCR